MKPNKLTGACMIIAMTTGFASTSFADGVPVECLSGCEPEEPTKGNNGWGNGIDGTNPGSDAGPPAQVETKNNREVWEKFEGKFEGR